MDKVKTWTVEEIALASAGLKACDTFQQSRSYACRHICTNCGENRHIHTVAAMLRAFADQTRQIEQMRGILSDGAEGDIDFALFQFNRIFPKDGAQ